MFLTIELQETDLEHREQLGWTRCSESLAPPPHIIIIIIMNTYIAPFRMPQKRFGQWSETETETETSSGLF